MKPVDDELPYRRHRERSAVDLPMELGENFPDCPRSKLTLSNLLKLLCNLERFFAISVSRRFSALPAVGVSKTRKPISASRFTGQTGVLVTVVVTSTQIHHLP
jgi:hypothetical protein